LHYPKVKTLHNSTHQDRNTLRQLKFDALLCVLGKVFNDTLTNTSHNHIKYQLSSVSAKISYLKLRLLTVVSGAGYSIFVVFFLDFWKRERPLRTHDSTSNVKAKLSFLTSITYFTRIVRDTTTIYLRVGRQ
jgi:hypothetical protein